MAHFRVIRIVDVEADDEVDALTKYWNNEVVHGDGETVIEEVVEFDVEITKD